MLNSNISTKFYNKLKEIIKQPKPKVVLSISGGVDSMVMLDILKKTNILLEIHIIHFNFNKHINAKNLNKEWIIKENSVGVWSCECYTNNINLYYMYVCMIY